VTTVWGRDKQESETITLFAPPILGTHALQRKRKSAYTHMYIAQAMSMNAVTSAMWTEGSSLGSVRLFEAKPSMPTEMPAKVIDRLPVHMERYK